MCMMQKARFSGLIAPKFGRICRVTPLRRRFAQHPAKRRTNPARMESVPRAYPGGGVGGSEAGGLAERLRPATGGVPSAGGAVPAWAADVPRGDGKAGAHAAGSAPNGEGRGRVWLGRAGRAGASRRGFEGEPVAEEGSRQAEAGAARGLDPS